MAIDQEKQQVNRAVWSAGEWDRVADYVAEAGAGLLDDLGVGEGATVLDIGTGSGGSIAIPAAERGAAVTGSDITDTHFDHARRRASEAGVSVEWVEADAQELPFDDDSFDFVCSSFGHMFAPDHELTAGEMVRVLKPGGTIGFCAWTPQGVIGQMFRTTASHLPPQPEGFQPPPLWGMEEHVHNMLEPHGFTLEFERKLNAFRDSNLETYVGTFERNFGPMVMARARLGEDWPALRADLVELFANNDVATDGTFRIDGEYLQTIARRV